MHPPSVGGGHAPAGGVNGRTVEFVSRERAAELAPEYMHAHDDPLSHLDFAPPSSTVYATLDTALGRAHVLCIGQIAIAALNLVSFWVTYWWTLAFSILCFVVAAIGAVHCRSPFHLVGTSCCCRSVRVIPGILYCELAVTIFGLLAGISAIIGALNQPKGSVEYALAVMSAVACFVLIALAAGVARCMHVARRLIKRPVAVIVVTRDGVAVPSDPYVDAAHPPRAPVPQNAGVRPRGAYDAVTPMTNDGVEMIMPSPVRAPPQRAAEPAPRRQALQERNGNREHAKQRYGVAAPPPSQPPYPDAYQHDDPRDHDAWPSRNNPIPPRATGDGHPSQPQAFDSHYRGVAQPSQQQSAAPPPPVRPPLYWGHQQ